VFLLRAFLCTEGATRGFEGVALAEVRAGLDGIAVCPEGTLIFIFAFQARLTFTGRFFHCGAAGDRDTLQVYFNAGLAYGG